MKNVEQAEIRFWSNLWAVIVAEQSDVTLDRQELCTDGNFKELLNSEDDFK